GEFVALTGPNGSGKTTLIRCALGLAEPSQGLVRLFGTPTSELSIRERARRVAWVPQEEAPRDNVRLSEYVLYGRYAHLPAFSGESAEDRRAAAAALRDVGLESRADSGVHELSGGERQRLLLARALAQEAPLLLLDEPTAHLDIGHQLDLLARVRALVTDRNVCAVAALHDLNLAARFADRVLVLSHGRRVAEGRPSEVLDVPLLRHVWGVEAERRRDPRTGETYLVPYRPVDPTPGPGASPGRGPVHVIGGGGAAAPLLRRLWNDGWSVTVGVVPLLDSDTETAEELGIPFVAELPFAPVGAESRDRNRRLLDLARAIVVGPG
ncbi:MAG: ATP-binding cassette domain-containing protein, partial [Thermoplasmata archaeon]|nr:ATP-binding cassette domain-containing protein [Thermoplasmata archaeon]